MIVGPFIQLIRIAITVIVLGLIVAVLVMLAMQGYSTWRNRQQPPRRVWARVGRKRTIESFATDCLITFLVEGGELELVVPLRVFMTLEQGTLGMLVHQGERFRQFIPMPEPREKTQPPSPPPVGPLDPDSADPNRTVQ